MLVLSALCVLLALATEGKQIGVVHGVVGYPFTLPCDITPPAPGDSPHLILWYKNIFGTPIYSVDCRNGIHSAKHWSDNKVFNDREEFYISELPGGTIMSYLNISDSHLNDVGPYRCRVDFWKAATRNVKISVELAEEVDTINLFSGKGNLVTDRIISSRVNGSVNITCRAFGGFPKPKIQWRVGDEVFEPSSVGEADNEAFSVIQLRDLKVADSGKRITCLAKNNDIYRAPSATVTLEIVLAPVRVEISRTISSFVAGKMYNLTCQVLGSNPTPTTQLWAGKKKLKSFKEEESRNGNIFTIVASFNPTYEDDGVFVSCRALNKYLPSEAIEDQWKINVVYPPISNIVVKAPNKTTNQNLSINVGKGFVLECEAMANPKPFKYHWRHISSMQVTRLSRSSSTLILTNIGKNQTGSYTCLAENLQGLGESEPIQVNVTYPPACKYTSDQQIYISVHESVDLSCEMDSNPRHLSFVWQMFPNIKSDEMSSIDVPSSQYTQHETTSILTFTPRYLLLNHQ